MSVVVSLRRSLLLLAVAASAVSCARDETTREPLLPTAPSASAAPNKRLHLYVHYDYLVFSGPDAHSDAPDPAAIQLVVDAFAAHDIDLVIDPKHTAIPGKPVMSVSQYGIVLCDGGQYDPFSLQDQYFHPTSNHDWHYAVFGDFVEDQSTNCQPSRSTGLAELPGNWFAVAMRGGVSYPPMSVPVAFMHELGHNLGLDHGGNEPHNWKPNYLSVMNYTFQYGIPYAASLGSTTIVGRRVDYSGAALPTLDESHLDETLGIQAGSTDITGFTAPPSHGSLGGLAPASGPIDWNRDGNATDTDVAVDIDWHLDCGCPVIRFVKLTGFDDWKAVRGYLDGTLVHGPKTIVHETRASEPTVTAISPASGPAWGGTTVTITGTHFDDATRVVFGPAGDARFTIMDNKTIIATAPPAAPGGYSTDVTVVSGTNASPSVAANQFTYTSVLPVITSVSPTSGPDGTVITVHGSYFTGTREVDFSGPKVFSSANFTLVDDHTVVVYSPTEYFNLLGAYHIVVYNAAGANASLGPNDVFVFTPPPPVLSGVTPGFGPRAGGTTVTLFGGGFLGATAVTFGTVNAVSFTVADDNTITAQSPPGTGTVDIAVTGPNGTSAFGAGDRFIYVQPAPTVTSVSPSSGPVGGGTVITIHGSGFAAVPAAGTGTLAVPAVSIGGVGVASYTIVNDATITAITIPMPAGTYHVTVTNTGGTSASVLSDQFTYF